MFKILNYSLQITLLNSENRLKNIEQHQKEVFKPGHKIYRIGIELLHVKLKRIKMLKKIVEYK